jgi:hypothetical protein
MGLITKGFRLGATSSEQAFSGATMIRSSIGHSSKVYLSLEDRVKMMRVNKVRLSTSNRRHVFHFEGELLVPLETVVVPFVAPAPAPKRELEGEDIIGKVRFDYDEAMLDNHLEDVLDFWFSKREPNGVAMEDAGRCKYVPLRTLPR